MQKLFVPRYKYIAILGNKITKNSLVLCDIKNNGIVLYTPVEKHFVY